MPTIKFTKMVASGNDFVVIESHKSKVASHKSLAKKICDRKYSVGADGILVLEKSRAADIKMRIFNPDGSEAQMCGNGARCIALWTKSKVKSQKSKVLRIETKAGIVGAKVDGENVKIKLTNPVNLKFDIPVKVNKRNIKANFIDTGVPHAVIFVEGINEIHVSDIGREVRYHRKFAPHGTNVDFTEVLNKDSIAIRTYERGVEDETLACGTGSVASALIFALKTHAGNRINVHTKSREVLRVYFIYSGKKFNNVWLEGKARIVFAGKLAY